MTSFQILLDKLSMSLVGIQGRNTISKEKVLGFIKEWSHGRNDGKDAESGLTMRTIYIKCQIGKIGYNECQVKW